MIPASEQSLPERLTKYAKAVVGKFPNWAAIMEDLDFAAYEIERQQAELADVKSKLVASTFGNYRESQQTQKLLLDRIAEQKAELERLRGELKEKETK